MNQNPLIDSPKSSQTPGLNPALTTALASLEVQLDQELTRYRRTRKTSRQQTSGSVESYNRQRKTALLNDIQLPAVSPITIHVENPFLTTETEAINFPQEFAISDIEETPTPPNSEKFSSSIVLTKIQPPENQTLLSTNDPPQQPDDYLESSEALLRSLTAEKTQTPNSPNSPNSRNSVLSPIGIGSMLLLLLASLTLGYVVLNPKNLPKLNFRNLPNSNSSPTAENTEVIKNNSQLVIEPKITTIAKYPNLATQEFRQVRDPKDIVDLTPKVKPTPLAIQPPLTPISPLPTLSPLPRILPTPLAEPTATSSPLAADVKPSANGYYYIIADNQGDKDLTAARQVVPDAYLSPNQKFIYLGALKTKDEIKRRLQQLEAKGIKGRLQQP
ncbi:hypothetical protein MEN41_10755 [Dolichospermum sp. ST_con]|nr:hypothetical protein [Dolichospermum sp. ST_con]MDD1421732.1 hypothetical protein [Dolichospermum sp. ST_sed1]MDD1424489.1 hypothetical protein [Dolichospermum sp. ST_sed9]MDD1432547.1 hypothetical protein [Dolichospermum sp. ST_sed6]MDD1436696.1 hypothetical protein [Dolichospermum sp. ST_sed10]MDD1440921.1 hypothetical protein [Dolichospermum sp. ST_sed3]MDD1447553.1 hypothetical protein [Dolichospermum sp. ST_sed8]MDD1455688.1 hypothetical protein [Dolichospermum sp. ST_sed7]MDD146168